MLRLIRLLAAALVAAGLAFVTTAAPATAAPTKKGYVQVQSGLLGLAGLLGVTVEATGPATMSAAGISFPVVGNTAATGTQKQVGGIKLTKPDGATLMLSSSHMDMETLEVSMVVDGGMRVVMFQGVDLGDGTIQLNFTPEGAAVVAGFFGLPTELLAPGGAFNTFGTATYHAG